MIYIDAHQHFWYYGADTHPWINEEMQVLKRDFLPENIKQVFRQNNIDGCIAVQAAQSEEETHFLLECASDHDFILGVVGWVDLRSDDLEQRLNYFSGFSKLSGFRHVVQDEPDPRFMLQPAFLRGIELLRKYNFTYDILVYPSQLEATLEVVRQFPAQPFVLDHIAKPYIKEGKIKEWERYIRQIASYKQVYCKVSGMITEADWNHWTYADLVPYLDVIFDCFGTERIMYGSDWPVCLLAGSYAKVKDIFERYIDSVSADEQAKIWGKNALRFYVKKSNS